MEVAAAFDMIAQENLDSLARITQGVASSTHGSGVSPADLLRISDVGRKDEELSALSRDGLKLDKARRAVSESEEPCACAGRRCAAVLVFPCALCETDAL